MTLQQLVNLHGIELTKKLTDFSQSAIYRRLDKERKGLSHFSETETKYLTAQLEILALQQQLNDQSNQLTQTVETEIEDLHQAIEDLQNELNAAKRNQLSCSIYDLIVRGADIRETYTSEHADYIFKVMCEAIQTDPNYRGGLLTYPQLVASEWYGYLRK